MGPHYRPGFALTGTRIPFMWGIIMTTTINDELILFARIFLTMLFVIFGWRKVRDFPGTVNQMVHLAVPLPALAAAIATFMEVVVAFAVTIGAFTRSAALLMAIYTCGTALIGHRYWAVKGAERVARMDGFYKDVAIVGGFLLLYLTGAGRYSIDAWRVIGSP